MTKGGSEMAYMAGGGGGYKKQRPKQANLGQKKRMKPKAPQYRLQPPERKLGEDSAKQLQKARSDFYNAKNPVKGGQLKQGKTRRLTPTTKPRGGFDKAVGKLKRDASDVWQGKKGYGKAIVDAADKGFSNWYKQKKKGKAPAKQYKKKTRRSDGPVVGIMKKYKARNKEIDRWTQ